MARKSKELEEIKNIFKDEETINEEEIEKLEIDCNFIYEIQENSIYITDERNDGYVLHSIESIILSLIFAIIANCNTFIQIHLFMCKHYEWLNKHIQFENGLPSISTVKRVVSFINPSELEQICVNSVKSYLKENAPIYQDEEIEIDDIKTMDGKTANSSDRKKSKNGKVSKMNAMSVMSVKNDYCEATEFIGDKTNEIPTGPDLLKKINIENCIVTFDAMSTQVKTIDYIVNKGGYYVAPVKGNQGTLEEHLRDYFNDKNLLKESKKENYYVVKEKAHGTAEKREYIFTNDIDWIYKKSEWNGLKSIGIAIRTYENEKGEKVQDTRYYISNIDASKVKLISEAIRKEWAIENKLHFYLDMVFEEDKSKSFVQNTQKNLNILRKFCMTILKIFKKETRLSMNSIRFNISMDFEKEIERILKVLI